MNLSRNHKIVISLFLGLAVAGFIDATYLSIEHYMGLTPPCTVVNGCEQVTTSIYSTFAGISVAVFGALYYLVVIFSCIHILLSKRHDFFKYVAFLTWAGLGASIYFTSLQVFVIHAYCLFCLTSATISLLLFICAHYLWREHHKYKKSIINV